MATDIGTASLGLFVRLILHSPMMAAPAFAALMGMDATLVLATLVISTAATPLTAPILLSAVGLELSLSSLDNALSLFCC